MIKKLLTGVLVTLFFYTANAQNKIIFDWFANSVNNEETQILPSPVGTIFTYTSFPNTTGLTIVNGSGTITNSANQLNFTTGTGAFTGYVTYSDAVNVHRYTLLEEWTQDYDVTTPSAINASSYGIGLGVYSVSTDEYSTIFRWVWDTAFNPGRVIMYTKRTTNNQVISSTGLTPTANTRYLIRVQRSKNVFTYTIFNSGGTQLFTTTFTTSLSNDPLVKPHNAAQWAIYNMGGTNIKINSWTVSSTANKNVDWNFVVDSNGSCCYPGANNVRYIEQAAAAKSISYNILGGISLTTADALFVWPEIKAMTKPGGYVYSNLGSNDVATGVPTGTWQANLTNMRNQNNAAGLLNAWGSPAARNSNSMLPVETYMLTLGGPVALIFQATKNAGNTGLQAAYNSPVNDGIHLNAAGNNACVLPTTAIIP